MKKLSALFAILATLGTAAGSLSAAPSGQTTGPLNFSFIHTSDTHIDTYFTPPDNLENARSWKSVRTMKNLGPVLLTPFGLTAHAPSFIINTGDFCEFGLSGVTGGVVDRYFGDLGMPTFFAMGNHDGTWAPPLAWMKKKFGGFQYSFDFLGVHFIAVKSPGIQDPRPSFGQEVINFLKSDLAKVAPTTPVILFFHHPLPGNEFASRYDYDRMLDVVERHNIMLICDGHGHSPSKGKVNNIDRVMGGSTFRKPNATGGYSIIDLDGKNIRVTYRYSDDANATQSLLNKPIPAKSDHPEITMAVAQQGTGATRQVVISAEVKQSIHAIGGGTWTIDDNLSGPLRMSGSKAAISVPASALDSGVHYARFTFGTSKQGISYDKSIPFAVENGTAGKDPVAAWRYQMNGGSRTTPLLSEGSLYIGGNDGTLYALDAATGKQRWTFSAGGPVTAAPAAYKDLIIFGTGDGHLRAVTTGGQARWDFPTGTAVMGHPLVSDSFVYFASTDATVYCLDAATGQKKWENKEPKFQVETKPVLSGNRLFFGCWDGKVYCLDAASGKTLWAKPGPRNQTAQSLPQYYAPADAEVVVTGSRLFATDRAAKSGSYDLDGNYLKDGPDQAVAFAPSSDGKAVYLRRMGEPVTRLDLDLKPVWQSDIAAGALPYAPVEHQGVVYGATSIGRLYALDAATGKTLWTYRVTPSLYIHTKPTVSDTHVYTIGEDGVVTAVLIPNKAG